MMEELLKGLPILVGSLLTIASSIALARRQAKIEIHRFRSQVIQGCLGKLVDKRLDAYPSLDLILSSLKKKVERKSVTAEDIAKASDELNDWDSQHAVLMSRNVAQRCYVVRKGLREIISGLGKDGVLSADDDKVIKLGVIISSLEIGLKFDLLIYDTESIQDNDLPRTYKELHARLHVPSRKALPESL